MRRYAALCSIAALCFFLIQCASISNFSTAKPAGAGLSKLTIGISKITTELTDSSLVDDYDDLADFFFFELMGTMGVTDRFDLSLKYTFPTAGFLEGKYCLLMTGPEKGFFLSPALRVGYTSFPTSETDTTADNNRIETSLPVMMSWFPAVWCGLTVAPVYSARFFLSGGGVANLAGGMASLSFGKKVGLIIEVDYLYNFKWEWHEIQAGAALYVPVKDLFSNFKLF